MPSTTTTRSTATHAITGSFLDGQSAFAQVGLDKVVGNVAPEPYSVLRGVVKWLKRCSNSSSISDSPAS